MGWASSTKPADAATCRPSAATAVSRRGSTTPAGNRAQAEANTRGELTIEEEARIGQLHPEGKPVAAIARLDGISRKSVYKALETAKKVA
jgi:hypothetical protein